MVATLWSKIIRFSFRLLYNELAWTYDAVSWLVSLGEWRRWQRAALPFVRGRAILEIGHGPGHMLLALRRAGHQAVGLDLSRQMGRQAQRRLRRAGVGAPLVRGDVKALPFRAAVFDSVLATFPTDYVISPATLAAVNRALRPNGRFVVIPEGHLTGATVLNRFIDWLYTITGQRSGAFAVDDARRWPAGPAGLIVQRRFIEAGFRVEITPVRLAHSAVTVLVAHKAGGVIDPRLIQSVAQDEASATKP